MRNKIKRNIYYQTYSNSNPSLPLGLPKVGPRSQSLPAASVMEASEALGFGPARRNRQLHLAKHWTSAVLVGAGFSG